MTPCTCKDICDAVGGQLLQDGGTITGVTTDSRHVAAGELFIPLVGERFDGHDYLEKALIGGAEGCLTMRTPAEMVPGKGYILVDDTRLALKALASWYRGKFNIPVVQVTGSAGKTTTKEMIACVLAQRYRTLRTEANYNNDIGTPQMLLRLTPEHQAAVIETGMNHFGEIRYLGEMVRPHFAVITNVGDAHIENMGGTRQGTLRAKCEIFENLDRDGVAVLCGDDALLRELDLPFRTLLCGEGENCNVRVTDVVEKGMDGTDCVVTTPRGRYALTIPTPGRYMIYAAAMAAAIGEELGLTAEEIAAGVASYAPVGSRMKVARLPGGRMVIDDSYNANPQAMAEALKCLMQTPCRRRVAVLGDMGELGELGKSAHEALGRLTAEVGLDGVVAIGELSRGIGLENPAALWFATIDEAMPSIRALFTEGTAVLVKASHAMAFHKIAEELER